MKDEKEDKKNNDSEATMTMTVTTILQKTRTVFDVDRISVVHADQCGYLLFVLI